MQRSKLQQMVKAAVSTQPTISTEGFLSDVTAKFKQLFKINSSTVEEVAADKATVSVKARELSKNIMQATNKRSANSGYNLTHTSIDAKWAIPGLDFKNQLDTANPTAHLQEMIDAVQRLTADTIDITEHYADELTAEFETIMNSIMTSDFSKATIDEIIDKSNKRVIAMPKPYFKLLQTKRHLPGNFEIYLSGGKVVTNATPCKYKSLPTLNVEQADYVAELLGKFTDGPLSIGPFIAKCVKAVDERKKLATCETLLKAINPRSDYAIKAVTDSEVIKRLYWQQSFEVCYVEEVAHVHEHVTVSLINWINASFK